MNVSFHHELFWYAFQSLFEYSPTQLTLKIPHFNVFFSSSTVSICFLIFVWIFCYKISMTNTVSNTVFECFFSLWIVLNAFQFQFEYFVTRLHCKYKIWMLFFILHVCWHVLYLFHKLLWYHFTMLGYFCHKYHLWILSFCHELWWYDFSKNILVFHKYFT